MEDIKKKICSMNLAAPYVWKLHLSQAEYDTLEQYLQNHASELTGTVTQELALLAIAYIAEWYKRVYNGGDQRKCSISCNPQKLWDTSGIDQSRFLYKSENGQTLALYSIYVLGGLAVNLEVKRRDNDKFLQELCRTYHGEQEVTLENLDNRANRAIAFKQSIIRQHSLYEFLKDILNHEDGIIDDVNRRLVERIKHANDEVLRSKFEIEWMVINRPDANFMRRQLRIWLKPEEVGGGQHQYLKYDRMRLWGIKQPERMKGLFLGVRWKNMDQVVFDLDKSNPLIAYSNNGKDGFVSWGVERLATCEEWPTLDVTSLEIVAYDDSGNEWTAQCEEMPTWMQLWRVAPYSDEWSSKKNRQHQTAVVYTRPWASKQSPDMQKKFKSVQFGDSNLWNWNYIYTDISLTDDQKYTVTLYNQMGYNQLRTKLYGNTICYHEGDKVKYITEDEDDGIIGELLPLIFGMSDVQVHHYETRKDLEEEELAYDSACDKIEFKNSDKFEEWTEDNTPAYGKVQIRGTYRGTILGPIDMLYLQGPIRRNFDQSTISYYDAAGTECIYQDTFPMDRQPLVPCIPLSIGSAVIEVYRPTLIKEIYLDDKVHTYVTPPNETFILAEIWKNRVRIADFSENGYHCYDGKDLPSLFEYQYNKEHCPVLADMQGYKKFPAVNYDPLAPHWLHLALTKKTEHPEKLSYYKWNVYSESVELMLEIDPNVTAAGDLIFQDQVNVDSVDSELSYMNPTIGHLNPFQKEPSHIELNCFEVACKSHLYFWAFLPLKRMCNRPEKEVLLQIKEKLLQPLRERRNGTLTDSDTINLNRFAKEFRLNINNLLQD